MDRKISRKARKKFILDGNPLVLAILEREAQLKAAKKYLFFMFGNRVGDRVDSSSARFR